MYKNIPFCIFFILITSCKDTFQPFDHKNLIGSSSVETFSFTTAEVNGEIIDLSEKSSEKIVQYGHCWGPNTNPTIEKDSLNNLGELGAKGFFRSLINNLSGNTTYYVRVYGKTTSKVLYGAQTSFRTIIVAKLSQDAIINVDITSASAIGNMETSNDGVISYGHCWSTNPKPTILDPKTNFGTFTGTTSFVSPMTGLTSGTTYYVCAYLINPQNVVLYSNISTFTTP